MHLNHREIVNPPELSLLTNSDSAFYMKCTSYVPTQVGYNELLFVINSCMKMIPYHIIIFIDSPFSQNNLKYGLLVEIDKLEKRKKF